jgi:hypothetical protein
MASKRDNDEERNERIDLSLPERRADIDQAADRAAGARKRMASAMPRRRIEGRLDRPSPDPKRRN